MTDILWNLVFFLIALGILIAIHEFGHFWVARRCGVKVERFSIGFGKSIWSRVGKDGTEYTLAMIPLGGYVKMLDERVDDVPDSLKDQAFNNQPLWQRSAIVAAGPLANFLFAFVVYWFVMMLGTPTLKPIIGEVTPNSIAAEAGITPEMELTSVSGIRTLDWEAVNLQFISHIGEDEMTLTVKPDANANYTVEKILDLSSWKFDPDTQSALATLGMTPYRPQPTTTLALVVEGGAAQAAGFKIGDKIQAIDGKSIETWQQVVEDVRLHPSSPLTVEIQRNGMEQQLILTPNGRDENGQQVGYAGFASQSSTWPEGYQFTLQYGPLAAIPAALDKTWQVVTLTVNIIKKLFTGDVSVKNLSGPISIAKGAGMTADFGLVYFLGFLALISVNLGIMNLFPLPVLDGGHLLFFGIEAVTRRPVSEKVLEIGYRFGTAILLLLMVVALFNDFTRL